MAGRVTPCVPLPRSLRPQYPKTPALHLPIRSKLRSALRLSDSAVILHPSTLIEAGNQPLTTTESGRRGKRRFGPFIYPEKAVPYPVPSGKNRFNRPPFTASGERDPSRSLPSASR